MKYEKHGFDVRVFFLKFFEKILKVGLDLQSYLRMCISRMNQENGIPFPMNVNDLPKNRGLEAMKEASRIAEKNGIADMTLEEINAEIDSVRKRDNK